MKIHKGASAKAVLGSAPIASTSLSAWKAATCHGNIWQMYGKCMENRPRSSMVLEYLPTFTPEIGSILKI